MTQNKGPRLWGRGPKVPIVWVLCLLAVTLFVGGGMGWWLGRISASPEARAMAAVLGKLGPAVAGQGAPATDPQESAGQSLVESRAVALELALRVRTLEDLLEEFKRNGQGDPKQMLRRAISDLSGNELEFVLQTAVSLGSDEMNEINDLPGFANRLIDIASSGLVEPEEDAGGRSPVYFTRTPERNNPAGVGRDVFKSSEHRVYAVFPRNGYNGPKVMVKWSRTDQPDILVFSRYSITPDQEFSWVWLEKNEGWDVGRYQVDIFSGDEAMTPIARGGFTVE